MSPSVKAVLFDFSQTLVNSAAGFRMAEKEVQARLLGELDKFHPKNAANISFRIDGSSERRGPGEETENAEGISESPRRPTTADSFLVEYRRCRKEYQETARGSRKLLWQTVLHHFGATVEDAVLEQWERDYWDCVDALTSVLPETIGVLKTLLKKYRLALISNHQGHSSSDRHQINQYPELAGLFEVVVIAGVAGVPAKPDRRPFDICLATMGLKASEAVYVGDDWRIDIRGARHAGLRAVWLQHHAVMRNWPPIDTDVPIVTSLLPLIELEEVLACSP